MHSHPVINAGVLVKGTLTVISEHACRKYSGRVERSGAAKQFNIEAINHAVIAHIRHEKTDYNELLMRGINKKDACKMISCQVEEILYKCLKG